MNDSQPPLLLPIPVMDCVTVMLNDFSALCEPDTAFTVNVDVPAVVGVPEIAPVEEVRARPSGRLPDDTDHVAPVMLAVRFAEYGEFVMPSGRLVVVILSVSTGELIVSVNCFSSLAEPYTALTVNVEVPAVVGVPEITPVEELSDNLAGRVPLITLQFAPVMLAASVAEYAVFLVPFGRLVVVIVIEGIALTVIVSCFSADCESFSALTVNVDVPAAVGVPVIAPVEELRVSPVGRVPDESDHVAPERLAARVAV